MQVSQLANRRSHLAFIAVTSVAMAAPAFAGPINTNVALTPAKGVSIFRLQYKYAEADGSGPIAHLNASTVSNTFVHGVTARLALFLTAQYNNRQVDRLHSDGGRFELAHDGIADFTFFAKYRFWENDPGPLETARWAAIGGLNVRSGDSDFTSDSYDPLAGAVYSWRRHRSRFDADLIYQLNTGRDAFRHDNLRYDLAWSYRLFPSVYKPDDASEFDLVAELNGRYTTDGSHELFLAPGAQFITERWAVELSLQLPVVQELAGSSPETDYRLVISMRFQW
ncbi:MAG: hypothetical protein V3W34_10355 [Phycisphaerae bacterium]